MNSSLHFQDFKQNSPNGTMKSFVSKYGMMPEEMDRISAMVGHNLPRNSLFGLFDFMKSNSTLDSIHSQYNMAYGTFTSRLWRTVDLLNLTLGSWTLFSGRLNYDPLVIHFEDGSHKKIWSIIDATECYISRPTDQEKQRFFYSGYKKRTTLKYNVLCCTFHDEIVGWDGPHRGPAHERVVSELQPYMQELKDEEFLMGDSKYRKAGSKFITYHEISEDLRSDFNSIRVRIERLNSHLKKWRVLSGTWRGSHEQHAKLFELAVNVHNFLLKTRNQ